MVDKVYCMNSFLMFRDIVDKTKSFSEKYSPKFYQTKNGKVSVKNYNDLDKALKSIVMEATKDGKAAIMLSGGMDSAILAKYMPKGSTAYTLKCIVQGKKVIDETERAAQYAKECGLKHKIIEIHWQDFENYSDILMKHKGMPIHSIEVQLYKASLQAKEDGFETIIVGDSADMLYGGLDKLLTSNPKIGDFIDRYSYVMPYKVLKQHKMITQPFEEYEVGGCVNIYKFINDYYTDESLGSYYNACETAGIKIIDPYADTYLNDTLDIERIKNGDSKYIVRELFRKLYNKEPFEKIPMPRAMNEWLDDWKGPERKEFWSNCAVGMSGDQKWLIYCLERFLNLIDENE